MIDSRGSRFVLILAFLLIVSRASVPGQEPAPSPTEPPPFHPSFALIVDTSLKEKFRDVRVHLQAETWDEAVRLLQSILDREEDSVLPVAQRGPDGKEVLVWGSARREAMRMLEALPPAAREFYEANQGQKARALLAEARREKDPDRLAEVLRLYLPTKAGADAARLLGLHHLDAGRPGIAARAFALVLDGGRADGWEALPLFQAALAFHRAGDKPRFDRARALLERKAPGGLTLGTRTIPLADLKRQLGRPVAPGPNEEWRMARGDVRRSGHAAGSITTLEPAGSLPTAGGTAGGWLGQALRDLDDRGEYALPAMFPLADSGRAVFRTQRGLAAVDLDSGQLLWESVSGLGLDSLAADTASFVHVDTWMQSLLKSHVHLLFDSDATGSLSAAGGLVYAVEGLSVIPWPESYPGFRSVGGSSLRLGFAPELGDAVHHSRLLAVEADSGKVVWEIGGRGEGPLDDTFFLGPPLPVGRDLYQLAEKNQELKLLCLDPLSGELRRSRKLGLPKNRLVLDGGRRLHACPLAHADGVLICPTNSGGVIAFDLLTETLLWSHTYAREIPPPPPLPPNLGRRGRRRNTEPQEPPYLKPAWKAPGPVIAGDNLLLTAPDETFLVCLGLRDGAPHWKIEKEEGDLYLAGVERGLALIAGTTHFRALRMADGTEAWRIETGPASGIGVLTPGVYYLPVRADKTTEKPAILALDLAKGAVKERVAVPGGEVPGNLVLRGNHVVSQSATALAVFKLK